MDYEKMFRGIRAVIEPKHEDIANHARVLWEEAGKPEAVHMTSFWFRAEQEIKDKMTHHIIKNVISPQIQDAVAQIKTESCVYSNECAKYFSDNDLMDRQMVVPDGVRLLREQDNHTWIIFEDSPKVRTILVDMAFNNNYIGEVSYDKRDLVFPNRQLLRLAFPYVIYGFRLRKGYESFKEKTYVEDFRYWFRTSPLKSIKDKVLISHLPNTEYCGLPCIRFDEDLGETLTDQIKNVIRIFWSTEFNYRLHTYTPSDTRLKSFQAWEAASKENPLFVLTAGWLNDPNYECKAFRFSKRVFAPYNSSSFVNRTADILDLKQIEPLPKKC